MAGRYRIYAKAHTDRQTEQAEELEVGSQQMAGTYSICRQTEQAEDLEEALRWQGGIQYMQKHRQTDRQIVRRKADHRRQTDRPTNKEADRKVSEQK